LDAAEQVYQQVKALEPVNGVAQQGLEQVALQKGLALKLQSMRTAKQSGDWVQVLALAKSMLVQQADHTEALSAHQEASLKLAPPAQEDVLGAAFRKPTSLEFREAPLRQIFDALSRSSGLNFILTKS
jgi:general secretion pathway protein D